MKDRKTVMSWLEGLTQDDWPKWHSDSEVQETAKAALELLKVQPEIVRCKDCKYSGHCGTEDLHRCVDPDGWFCHDGKRRECGSDDRKKVCLTRIA